MIFDEGSWVSSGEINSVTRVQILDEAVCISYTANTLEKCNNSTILTCIGLLVEQQTYMSEFEFHWVSHSYGIEKKLHTYIHTYVYVCVCM